MNRRTYLAGAVGSLAGLAGCSNPLGGDGNSGSSDDDRTPTEVVTAFYDAAGDGDADAAAELFHPDAELPPPSEEAVAEFQTSSARLEGTTVVEETDDRVVIRATVSSMHPIREERVERERPYELRPAGGAWRIYAQPLPGGGGPAIPNVQWDSSEEESSGGITAVSFTHGGGDDVDPGSLRIRAGSSTFDVPDADEPVQVAVAVTIPFDAEGSSVAAGEEVELVWVDEGDSTTLMSHTLTAETAGAPTGDVEISS